jgi:hypothetical protein
MRAFFYITSFYPQLFPIVLIKAILLYICKILFIPTNAKR